jgi:hypothetical protein
MPAWAAVIIGFAALVTAVGVIWKKVVRPLANAVTAADRALPVMLAITETFHADTDVFLVLREIAAQFRTAEQDAAASAAQVATDLEAVAHPREDPKPQGESFTP